MDRTIVSHDDHGVVFEFTPDMDAAVTVADGASLTIETVDSLSGAIQTDDDLLDEIPDEVNAATGPVAVEGAEPGDVLAVEIEAVRVAEDRGRVVTTPGFGLRADDDEIESPRTRVTPTDGDVLDFGGVSVPIDPCIGTIGVAPAEGSYTTLVPHDHGGNLDTTDVCAGSTVYFPVFQPGGLLAMGDSKAAMADGEMCGTGAEIATRIDATVSVVEASAVDLARPLIETDECWKTLASADTLEEACEIANRDAGRLLAREHGFDETEAYMFSSLVGGLEISQVVDPLVTVRNAIPKAHLSSPF